MLFNSYEFIFFFLPFVYFIYFYLNKLKLAEASKVFLVFSSLFFYSWWNVVYLPLILLSIFFNYAVGAFLSKRSRQCKVPSKHLLVFGIVSNLALLGYFKYSNFFIQNLNSITGSNTPLLDLALPLAISFFTFQQISYLVDSYRQDVQEHDFLNYALFVTFFPQLIAGPIVHHKEMMPQFAAIRNKVIQYRNVALGMFIFSIGLFKKVVIADSFAIWATAGFDSAATLTLLEAWVTSLSYTFQLYFDFSGYTDMAIGAALLFNIKLPINFNSPYKAVNIQDFWRRWHITLSRFLRDYVYIPLGGSRKGHFRTYANLMATFIIGGLWHGAGWTFIFWGFLHGLALVVHRLWSELGIKLSMMVAWFITFNFINISWVFFRAKNWDDALKVLSAMFNFEGLSLESQQIPFLALHGATLNGLILWFGFAIIILTLKNTMALAKQFHSLGGRELALSVVAFFSGIMLLYRESEFIYFNF